MSPFIDVTAFARSVLVAIVDPPSVVVDARLNSPVNIFQ